MKKFISAIAAAAIMSSGVFGQCVNADVGSLQLETAKSSAEDFVSQYYYSMYTDSDIDLYGRAAYEEMADYLSAKLRYQQSICGDVVNYRVYTYTKSVEESEEAFLFNVISAVDFNYVGADFDSGFTASNQVMVEKGGECRILDVMIGGGINDSLLEREKLDLDNCFWEKENVTKEAIAEVCDYLDEAIEEEMLQMATVFENEAESCSINAFTSSVTQNQRYKIVQYAMTNTRTLMPEENGGVPNVEVTPVSGDPSQVDKYCDFSVDAPGNYDCTNFTSHCLLAGGAEMNFPKDKDKSELRIESEGWFFMNMNQRSHAWSSVNSFFTFVTTNKGTGPKAVKGDLTYSTKRELVNCDIGDIIQIDYNTDDNDYDHNVVITSVAPSINGKYWPAVTGRSGSNSGISSTRNIAITECRKEAYSSKVQYRVLRLTSLT